MEPRADCSWIKERRIIAVRLVFDGDAIGEAAAEAAEERVSAWWSGEQCDGEEALLGY